VRIGQGFDVHALVKGRKLVLGGVTIPFEKGLAGHSDADVLVHAVCDALLGAAALGDIGRHFPDSDPKYKSADSRAKGSVGTIGHYLQLRKGKSVIITPFPEPGCSHPYELCLLLIDRKSYRIIAGILEIFFGILGNHYW